MNFLSGNETFIVFTQCVFVLRVAVLRILLCFVETAVKVIPEANEYEFRIQNKEDQTLEAHNASGYIFMYLDGKTVEKFSFSQKAHIKFVFLRSPLHQNQDEEKYVNCKTEPSSPLDVWFPDCNSNSLEDDMNNENNDLLKENEIHLSENVTEEANSDSNYELYSLGLMEEIVATFKLEQDVSNKELVSSSYTAVSGTDSLAGLHCVSSSDTADSGTDSLASLHCKLCQKWFPCYRKNKEHMRNPACQSKCIRCDKIFPSKGDLFRHQFAAYNISFLDSQFPEFNLKTEAQMSNDKEKIVCPICGVVTSFNQFMYRHVYSHFHDLSYKCCLCGIELKTATHLKTHCKNHLAQPSTTAPLNTEVAEPPNNAAEICSLVPKIQDDTSKLKKIATNVKKKTISSNFQELISSTQLNEKNLITKVGFQLAAIESRDIADINQEGKKSYHCPYCKKSFSSRGLLHSHKETPSLNLKCQSCEAILPSQAWMIIHEFEAHKKVNTLTEKETLSVQEVDEKDSGSDKLQCNIRRPKCKQFVSCPVCFVPVTRIVLHEHIMRRHTQEKPYQCCVCGFPCHGSNQYRHHCDNHIGQSKKGLFRCSSCPEIFTSRSDFNKHIMVHKTVCHFCNVDFKLTSLLDVHYNTEHLDQLIKCQQCGKRLPTERKLKLHEKHHRFNIRRPCPKCGAMVVGLGEHMRRHHTELDSEFLCSICPKKFKHQCDLQRHLSWHASINNGEKFACPKCPKTFSSRHCLLVHVKVHLKCKLHQCPVCRKQFRAKFNLKTHMRLHSVHKLFHCDICNQGFNFKVSLKNHQKSKH
ncbi:hypothetical protein Btru_075308 [Bulinus truncatus]|nr:hypothetical protein Btru_075308 [Bulinus truncatus]